MVFLFADDCNTVVIEKRTYRNNVYSSLKNQFHGKSVNVACFGHMVHSCLQAVVADFPINTEVLVVKHLKYFHIYTACYTVEVHFNLSPLMSKEDFAAWKC
jgi:hypothetical protein